MYLANIDHNFEEDNKNFLRDEDGNIISNTPVVRNMNLASVEQNFEEDNKNFFRDEDGNIIFNTPVVQNTSQSDQLDELLETFDLIEVKPYLQRAKITFESLKYLSKEDIKEAIPPIGLRASFREKLFYWRKDKYDIDEDNLAETIARKVIYWLQNQSIAGITTTTTPTSSLPTSLSNSKLSKSLKLILEDSLKGKSIISFYEKNLQLSDLFRRDLIDIILEDIFYREVKLSPKDFTSIVDEILENFPREIREYYFIPRGTKANPGGKLWDKYVNQRSKRVRSSGILKDTLETSDSTPQNACTELDEPVLKALKASLSTDFSNWNEVLDKWERTFLLRQKELKTNKSRFEFLSEWPLYSKNKSEELINIDFKLLHPDKSHLLFSKWSAFMEKMSIYYNLNIKDKKSKEVFMNSIACTDQSSLNCIYTFLLNAIILPTLRFQDASSKNLRKISIADAMESFVVYFVSINDYKKAISDLREKFYNRDLTIQPFIIVVGSSIYNLEEFYVYFDKTLLKFQTFLQCLDTSFKIMQTLSLEYPRCCKGPWTFIQEYFYEIKPVSGHRLPSICTLLNFLNCQ